MTKEEIKAFIRDAVNSGKDLDTIAASLASRRASSEIVGKAVSELAGSQGDPGFNVGDVVRIGTNIAMWRIDQIATERDTDGRIAHRYNISSVNGFNRRIEYEGALRLHDPAQEAARVAAVSARPAAKASSPKKGEVTFDSVIIDDDKKQQILEALEQVNKADLIFDVWGFGETVEKGKGVSLLFYGPPGTGKTLMGQAIASKLGRKLKVISTADIESSAPGEAERNIRQAFEDAGKEGNILLFDECDSLIYSRENTGPIMAAQVNQLLSSIEKFEGVTIFTTNRLGQLDEAVNRRLALKLELPMPDEAHRVKIWERMIPKAAPIADDVDFKKLAIISVTGGYIKNAVLRAARMAAILDVPDEEKKITMAHFVRAIELEVISMEEFEEARGKTPKVHMGNGVTANRSVEVVNGRMATRNEGAGHA